MDLKGGRRLLDAVKHVVVKNESKKKVHLLWAVGTLLHNSPIKSCILITCTTCM